MTFKKVLNYILQYDEEEQLYVKYKVHCLKQSILK